MKKEKARISKVEKKKKPWPWLMVAARGVVVEVVREVERIGRIALGERKKRELLEKIAGMKEKPPEQEDRKHCEENTGTINILEEQICTGEEEITNQLLLIHLVSGGKSGTRKKGQEAEEKDYGHLGFVMRRAAANQEP